MMSHTFARGLMSKILLFGKYGQVGSELAKHLPSLSLVALGKDDIDILNLAAIHKLFNDIHPEIVINTVAYNDVDGAELNPDFAVQINAIANGFLAKLCKEYGAVYITYSSDFVFDGSKGILYVEDDVPNPINKYGESKLRGDIEVQESGADYFILRTSSVYSLNRPCFLTKIIRQAKDKDTIYVRSDLVSSPTSACFLAQATAFLIGRSRTELRKYSGLYNLCSSGSVSRYEWAKTINGALNLQAKIVPMNELTVQGPLRPVYSALNNQLFQNTFGFEIPEWDKMLFSLLEQ
jgi:dTDP-4-dehydrorhamnose reductase